MLPSLELPMLVVSMFVITTVVLFRDVHTLS